MKMRIPIIALIVSIGCGLPLKAAERTVENQFRADYEVIVRRAWKVGATERSDEVSREVDEMVAGARIHDPRFLEPAEKSPSDADIQKRWEKLVALEGGFTGRGFPLWEHYIPLWKARKLNVEQKVIFSRMIEALIAEHELRKRQRDGKNG